MDHRVERISEALREELAELIAYELSDPRIGSVNVTDVHVSPDKRHAFVRVGIGPDSNTDETLAALAHATHFLRRQLAIRLELFRIPELHFEVDTAAALGGRMAHLLKRIHKGRPRE